MFLTATAVPPTWAQNGACPRNTALITTANGTYPSNMLACHYRISQKTISTNGKYPCSQFYEVDQMFVPTQPAKRNQHIVFAPPVSYYLSQQAHVRFLLFHAPTDIGVGNFPGTPLDFPPNTTVEISYVGDDEQYVTELSKPITDFTQVKTWFDTLLGNVYYRVYLVDAYINTDDGYGGYFRIGVHFLNSDPADYNPWGISSLQIGAVGDALPGHCPFPNTEWPQTPAPTNSLPATWTPVAPNGTVTPYPTVNYTPQATAVGGTPYPTPNAIPIIFPTLPAQPTPTPWPVKRMPRVNYPDIPPANNSIQLGGIETPDTSGIDLGSIADGLKMIGKAAPTLLKRLWTLTILIRQGVLAPPMS